MSCKPPTFENYEGFKSRTDVGKNLTLACKKGYFVYTKHDVRVCKKKSIAFAELFPNFLESPAECLTGLSPLVCFLLFSTVKKYNV